MADYDWFNNDPTEAEIVGGKWRAQGFTPVFADSITISGGRNKILHYLCRRGCGCVVWSPEQHIKNVCTRWEPVASDA